MDGPNGCTEHVAGHHDHLNVVQLRLDLDSDHRDTDQSSADVHAGGHGVHEWWFEISAAQLSVNPAPTYERLPYNETLRLCQRYYEAGSHWLQGGRQTPFRTGTICFKTTSERYHARLFQYRCR